MKTTICNWKGCKIQIQVDNSFEGSTRLPVTVVGWCGFHKKVQAKQRELFSKLDKKKHHSETANFLYRNDRKKYNKIAKQALIEAGN